MIKILVINTVHFGYGGGMSNVIMNYYNAMDKIDVQIDFVAGRGIDNDLEIELESNGSKVYCLNSRKKRPLRYARNLTKIIKDGKYDIVHAHGNSCTLAIEMYSAKKGGAKVRIPHSHNSTCEFITIHRILKRIFDSSYTNAFACGEKAGKWLYNDKEFTIINNGINVDNFTYNPDVKEEYIEKYKLQGKKVIGHIGCFCYQKNHEFLIEVFNELYKLDSNYRLLLVGDGELRKEVEKQVNDLGLKDSVIFLGQTFEVHKLVQAMDMIIMPSRFEGLPLTLIEAQSACLPCYVSDVISEDVAITDLVKFISLKKSPKEWAELINNAPLVNRGEAKELVYRQIVDAGYSIKDNAERLKKMYFAFLNSN